MNDVATLLARCHALGATFTPGPDGKLKVKAPAPLPEELQEQLKRHKEEILTLLRTAALAPRQEPLPDPRALYQEMTRAIPEDFPAVDAWLAEAHPCLWQRIRDLDEELLHMEQEGAPEATYRAKLNELIAVCQGAKSLREGTCSALLVKCTALGGAEVWVVKDAEQARAVMGDGKAILYTDEFELLRTKIPAQIRDVHKVKLVFPGCRVVQ